MPPNEIADVHAAANLAGRHHFHLLNDPGVYESMRSWLTEQPQQTMVVEASR